MAATAHRNLRPFGAGSDRERLRSFSRDDQGTRRNWDRRQRRRNRLAALRIQMETRRRDARAGLVRAAPAKTRLADVVCRARKLSGKSVVWQVDCEAGMVARCEPIAREESFFARTAALHSRHVLSLSFHDVARTQRDRRVVETRGASGIFANGFTGSGTPTLRPVPFFFFNDTATTEIYTLSLHDALPI